MYKHYENITREVLDTIKVGDLVRVNDWTSPMLVKAVIRFGFTTADTRLCVATTEMA